MQKSRSELERSIRVAVKAVLINKFRREKLTWEEIHEVSGEISQVVAEWIHQNHYPMAPEPEFLEDPTKPPVDPGPGRIA